MKRIRSFFITAFIAFAALHTNAQLNIPKTVDESDFNDDKVFIYKDKVSFSGNELSSSDGWGAFTMQIQGAPDAFSFDYCRNQWGKNNEMGIQESPDNQNWTDIYVGNPPTDWQNLSGNLKLETRYIRFWYKASYKLGDWWTKNGYLRNITINKAIYSPEKEITASTKLNNTIEKTISVEVTNTKGDIVVVCNNPDVTISPERISREEAIAQKNIVFTISYTPTKVNETTSEITFKDEGYEDNFETVKAILNVTPSTPVAKEATEITSNSFTANWEKVEGFKYLLTVKKDGTPIEGYENIECTENNYTVSNLQPNTIYAYTVKETNGTEVSEESNSIEVITTAPKVSVSELDVFTTESKEAINQELTISGLNLISDIQLSLKNDTAFAIDKNTITVAEKEATITITYTPTVYGEETDQLVITTEYAEDITIDLTGTNAPVAPKALEAERVTNSGFTAKWEKVAEATDYLLTVTDKSGEPIVQYNGIKTGDVDSYEVKNLQPTTEYTYYVHSLAGETSSFESSNEINVTTVDGAVITAIPEIKDFSTANNGTAQQTLNINGTNLFSDISVVISGSEFFTADKQTIPFTGGILVISYSPKGIGNHTATLTLSGQGAEDVIIPLNGISTPEKATVVNAENISTSSFTAKWNKVDGAEDYLLSVYKGNDVLKEYNNKSASGNLSLNVTGLEEGTYYNYSVKAANGNSVGEASDRISVRTLFTPAITVITENNNSVAIKWSEPYKADKYLVTLKKNGSAVNGYNEKETSAPMFTFTSLETNTEYKCSVTAVFGDTKIPSGEKSVSTTSSQLKQLNNSDFESWEGSGNTYEPVNWNSFGTGTGSLIGTAVSMSGVRMEESTEARPGSKGAKSVKIWTGSAFGVKANGNLTTGRINAGAMSAADPQNYNFTDINDEAFSERLGTRPDSITVWAKYTSTNAGSKARISAIIHDNYSYRDPSGSDSESPNHVVATAELNFNSNGGGWQRLSIPFNYAGNSLSPDFMLVSFTSNMTPGGGDVNDALIVDDIQLIYKPSLKAGNISKSSFKAGESISVDYEIKGSMSASNINGEANTVSLQISDANGSFAAPKTIASIKTDESGILSGTIPSDLPEGERYKLRVVTTNYPMIAEASGTFSISNSNSEPALSYSGETDFETTIGGYDALQEINITGKNIEGEIFLTVNSKSFKVNPEVLPSTGGKVKVLYSPTVIGTEEAELAVTAEGAKTLVIKLNGTANAPSSIYDTERSEFEEISIYPNPVIDIANVIGTASDATFCIYSVEGKMVKAGRLAVSKADVTELPQGIYIMVVENRKIKFVK